MKACMRGLEEVNDGGTQSSSSSNAAVTSNPFDVVVGEQGPDDGPISLVARRRHSSINLASSNIADHVSFLIFTASRSDADAVAPPNLPFYLHPPRIFLFETRHA